MKVGFVIAMARNGLIGRDGKLPWRLPDDLRRFRRITWGKAVIMGRKTFESIGKPLDGRTNIVLSRDPRFRADGCVVVQTADDALRIAKSLGEEAMVIGGAAIYGEFAKHCSLIHLTFIDDDFGGVGHNDVVAPPFLFADHRVIWSSSHPADNNNPHSSHYLVLHRSPSNPS